MAICNTLRLSYSLHVIIKLRRSAVIIMWVCIVVNSLVFEAVSFCLLSFSLLMVILPTQHIITKKYLQITAEVGTS